MRKKGDKNKPVDWEQRGIECRARQATRLEENNTDWYETALSQKPVVMQRVFTKVCWAFGRQLFKLEDLKCNDGEWMVFHDLVREGFIIKEGNLWRIL